MKNTKRPRTLTERGNYTAAEWIDFAGNLARGGYQSAIVYERQRISGSDLRGSAAKYSGRYASSRDALMTRMSLAGIPYKITTGENGLRSLEIG